MAARAPRTRPANNGRTTPRVKVAKADEVALLKAQVYDLSSGMQQTQLKIQQINQRIAELTGVAPAPVENPAAE